MFAAIRIQVGANIAAGASAGEAVPLEILEPAERAETVQDFPVSLGLIFLEGELTSAPGGAVVDDLGSAIPFDWEVTGWWPPETTAEEDRSRSSANVLGQVCGLKIGQHG